MKRILSLILVTALCFSLGSVSVSAAYDSTLLTFDEITNTGFSSGAVTEMKNVIKAAGGSSYIGNANATLDNPSATSNTSKIYPYKWNAETEATYADEFGVSMAFEKVAGNGSILWYEQAMSPNSAVIEFSIMMAQANSEFAMELRLNKVAGGDTGIPMLKFDHQGKVLLRSRTVTTYQANTWYDVQYSYNPKKGYVRLGLKVHGTETYSYYDNFYIEPDYKLADGFSRVTFGWYTNSNSGAKAYMDNVRVQVLDTDIVPTLNSYGDEFEGELVYSNSPSDWRNEWRAWNVGSTSGTNAEYKTVDGLVGASGKVLSITTPGGGSKTPQLGRTPFDYKLNPAVRHNIKFKFGGGADAEGNHDGGYKGLYVYTTDPTRAESRTQESWIFAVQNETLQIIDHDGSNYVYKDTSLRLNPNELYDCEFIYDAAAKIAKVAITDERGVQIVCDINNRKVFENADGSWRLLSSVIFSMRSSVESTAYFDEFEWNVQYTGEFAPTDTFVKSELTDSANMNESVVYEFTQTPLRTNEALKDAVVTVTSGGEEVNTDYTFTEVNGDLAIKFRELEPNTEYTVSISGVKSLAGENLVSDIDSFTFTTNAWDVKASKPTVTNESTTAKLAAAYDGGRDVHIIAAAYDASGRMIDVKFDVINVNSRTESNYVFNHSFAETPDHVRSYIWSDFVSMIPFAEPGTSKAE